MGEFVLGGSGWLAAVAALSYLLLACWRVWRWRLPAPVESRPPAITVLKPLCGDEPRLEEALRSFCRDAGTGVQIVFGARDPADPAVAVARRLIAEYPDRDLVLAVDPTRHGENAKVGNLFNMLRHARHELIAISDSDTLLAPGELARAAAPLADPAVGAVTCLYKAAPRQDWPSILGGMFIDDWFLTSAVVDAGMRPVSYCFGPLSIVRRDVLAAIGGFASLADHLADDFMLGRLIAGSGRRVLLAPVVAATVVAESWRSLLAHELRWARTVRAVKPGEHALSVVTHALPLTLLSLLSPWPGAGLAIALPLALRFLLHGLMRRRFGHTGPGRYWLLPLRELLCFAVWGASLLGRDVVWRDRRFRIGRDGVLRPVAATP